MQQASQSAKNICISTHSVNIISYFKLYSYFIGKIFAEFFANKKSPPDSSSIIAVIAVFISLYP